MVINESDFRHCLGRFATGVTVATTLCNDGSPCGLTISSFASVSLNPPMILFSLDKKSSSYSSFLESDYFAINILSEEQWDLSQRFAAPSANNWAEISYTKKQTSCPVLEECLAYIECEKKAVYEGGDHSIFLGQVVNLHHSTDKKPLLYYRGQYNTLGKAIT